MGGHTEEWSTVYATMPCRLEPTSGAEQALYGSERTVVTHKMFYERKYTITEANRVTIGGKVYDVELVKDAAGHTHHWEAELQQIRGVL